MATDLDPIIIKRTQDSLGKYVKKPHLTEKLLKKPPFGFLHDVFRVVIRDTECFAGLYSPEELIYENIKDREGKMKFLQKMIDVVKLTTKSNLAIRTSKIVAGHEPEKTNELLQLMGEIIDNKLDWKAAVEQVLAGKPKESSRKTKDSTTKVAKDAKTKDKIKEKESKIKDAKTTKTSGKSSVASSNKVKEKSTTKVSSKEKSSSKGTKETEKSTKKLIKETTTTKTKLAKTPSQTSSKSSPSPNVEKAKVENAAALNENDECKHEEIQQQVETKVSTLPRKSSEENVDNELIKNKEIVANNRDETIVTKEMEKERLSAGKTKNSSAKSRKSSASKKEQENSLETLLPKENINNLEMKNDSLPSHETVDVTTIEPKVRTSKETIDHSQQEEKLEKLQKSSEIKIAHTNHQNKALTQISTQKQPSPTPPSNSNVEIKRENTFTRENSKDSSSNQSSLVNRPRTSLRPPSARPPSARPGAPRRRDKNIEIILQPNDQIKMSGIQVKLETFGDLDDDGDNLVIIENPNANNDAVNEQESNLTESEKMMQSEAIEQGHLVQQILETQKELIQNDGSGQRKSDKDSTNGLVMRQTSARHMNNLRDVIQNLTKSINPLGKLMDFIPEDIDAMQLEFTMWRDTYTQAANELKREKSLTESATEPMKNQLIQIEANIAEYMEMIDASRVKILQNSEKVLKMLTS
ncbi:hypothetical protein DOY81_000586 [Sarcophaga bullata]|nr:hypothetical protein DOY81_000586 [Sarcophaga bullata]